MFAVSQYQKIEAIEKENLNPHLVAVLFIRPNLENADAIVSDFDYLHCRSGACCSIYAAGYTNDFTVADNLNYMKATTCNGLDWYYSAYDYDNFKDFSCAPVFDNKSLKNIWNNIELLSIDGIDPEERLQHYIEFNKID